MVLVKSVQKALRIVELLASSSHGMGVVELAGKSNLPPATAYRILRTLLAAGYVRQDDRSNRYLLTTKISEVGGLASGYQETSSFTVTDGQAGLHIDLVESWHHVFTYVTERIPPHCTVAGKGYIKAMSGDRNWTDYTVEVDVTLLQADPAHGGGLLVRADEKGDNGFRFWIKTDRWRCQFAKWVNNRFHFFVEGVPDLDIRPGETYHLKVIAEGHRYQCFVGDRLIIDYEDEGRFRESGRIGLIACDGVAGFDNLAVSGTDVLSSPP